MSEQEQAITLAKHNLPEYANRYYQDYETVLWINADSRESLISGYVGIANLLGLPQKAGQEQMLLIWAVQEWLRTRSNWLLIFDNADDLKMVREFLPSATSRHIILTTRASSTGSLAQCINLRERMLALEISEQLGGLPLALDQAVLIDMMDEASAQQWAKYAIRIVYNAFPEVKLDTWSSCERLLPHALSCATYIERYRLLFPEAARMLNRVGTYLFARARYVEAESLYRSALAIYELVLSSNHPDTAASLNNLASLYQEQGKLEQAEPLYQRALAIWEQKLGPGHPTTVITRKHLASLLRKMGRTDEATKLETRSE